MSNSLELSPRGLPLTFAAAACARQLSWNLRVLVHRESVSLTTRCLVHGAVLLQPLDVQHRNSTRAAARVND